MNLLDDPLVDWCIENGLMYYRSHCGLQLTAAGQDVLFGEVSE